MKTVDEFVSKWTGEEREKLKDLIEECREREKQLVENARSREENLTELTQSLTSIFAGSHEMKEEAEKMADNLLGVYLHSYNQKGPLS